MDPHQIHAAEACLRGAETDGMTFPEIVERLMRAGFESYAVDFRRATATYYRPDGDSHLLPTHRAAVPVAGYTYAGFCRKVMAAGCAGYVVSFSGRRAVYLGRTAETHEEPFPR